MSVLRLRPARWWAVVVVVVLAASLGTRLVAGGVPRWVLATDAAVLAAGATVVVAGLRRAAALTRRALRWQAGLAALFALGALRAALWAAGAPVAWANRAALVAALAALGTWAVRRRRAAAYRAPAA